MMKLNLQFFAHKKGVGSTKNGRGSLKQETFFSDSVEQRFIRALM